MTFAETQDLQNQKETLIDNLIKYMLGREFLYSNIETERVLTRI
jgi:hypothetical protein